MGKNLLIIVGFLALISSSCTTTPTGRSQLKLVNDGQMSDLGDDAFRKIKSKTPRLRSGRTVNYVKCVSKAVLRGMGENPSRWEIQVFKDSSPNAFALPGNNIGVHTGMLKMAKNQHQLAAVIGHEIGHVKANHGNERMSQNLLVQAGLLAADLSLDKDSKNSGLIMAGLGIGAQFGVLLPFSRKHESEADLLGLKYMAQAGFDPRQAAQLWINMKKAGGGPPEILSTHPAPNTRIHQLRNAEGKYMALYQSISAKPKCKN